MIPGLWHDVADERLERGQVTRKDSRGREVAPLHNCQRKE